MQAAVIRVGKYRLTWLQRWFSIRDRCLSSPKFQRWAAGFPLTRHIARRRAHALFDLCAGFVYSQVLFACVRLRLFEQLRGGPQSIATLAMRLSLSVKSATVLIDAATSLRLLAVRADNQIGLGPHGAALLGNPAVLAMIEHHHLLYADLQDPLALLRNQVEHTRLARYWAYAGVDQPSTVTSEQITAYTALMSSSQSLVAEDILDAYPVGKHLRLLDVGGGEGTFLLTAAAHAPQLQCVLFDLPAVAARANANFAAAGLVNRAQSVGGNFLTDDLPGGADLISLVRVVHDHDDREVVVLLRAARKALRPGGALLVAEPLADTADAESMGAYFGFYLLAMGTGRPRSSAALEAMLRTAGFSQIQILPTRRPLQTGLLLARP